MINSKFKLFLALILSLVSVIAFAQNKPLVGINFAVDKYNAFYDTFEDDIIELEDGMTRIIADELNRYINSFEFVPQEIAAESDILKITLIGDNEGAYFEQYLLLFEYRNEILSWVFLNYREFYENRTSIDRIIGKLKYDWLVYLEENTDEIKRLLRY